MATQCCSSCTRTRPISSFLKNTSAAPGSRVFKVCIPCREAVQQSSKRKASRQLQPKNPPNGLKNPFNAPETVIRADNMPRETIIPVQLQTRAPLQPITAPVTRPQPPQPPQPIPQPAEPLPPGFLSAEKWQ